MSKKRLRARERIKQLERNLCLQLPIRQTPRITPEIKEIFGAYQVPYPEREGQFRKHHREQACVGLIKYLLAHREEFINIEEVVRNAEVYITARMRVVAKEPTE